MNSALAYSGSVKWAEAQAVILERMRAQPRGYQAELANRIGKTPGYVSHILTGRRPIPEEHLDAVLASLGLQYDVILTEAKAADNAT